MGVHIDDTCALGVGFHRALSSLNVGTIYDIGLALKLDMGMLGPDDLYDAARQRIFDQLQEKGQS